MSAISCSLRSSCLVVLLVLAGLTMLHAEDEPAAPAALTTLTASFDGEALDASEWTPTRQYDFSEYAVDVKEGRLRLHCATMGTDDSTVKALGVVSLQPVDLTGSKQLSFELDWNHQANGCYMTAGVVLCPTFTTVNPEDEPAWLKLEYVGVPPGRNARAAVWRRQANLPRWLYNEGWPAEQRTGRLVSKVKVDVRIADGVVSIYEDGKLLYNGARDGKLPFDRAYIYLQMTSHSNYPAREMFFDNVAFGALPEPAGQEGQPAASATSTKTGLP